jgi:hypothetical protein
VLPSHESLAGLHAHIGMSLVGVRHGAYDVGHDSKLFDSVLLRLGKGRRTFGADRQAHMSSYRIYLARPAEFPVAASVRVTAKVKCLGMNVVVNVAAA